MSDVQDFTYFLTFLWSAQMGSSMMVSLLIATLLPSSSKTREYSSSVNRVKENLIFLNLQYKIIVSQPLFNSFFIAGVLTTDHRILKNFFLSGCFNSITPLLRSLNVISRTPSVDSVNERIKPKYCNYFYFNLMRLLR